MGLLAKTAHHDVHCTTASHAGLFTHSGDTSGCLALGSAPLLSLNPLSMHRILPVPFLSGRSPMTT